MFFSSLFTNALLSGYILQYLSYITQYKKEVLEELNFPRNHK